MACAAALATLKLVETELMENASAVGSHLLQRLQEMRERHPLIGDVRGLGLMIGVELVTNRDTRQAAAAERNQIVQRCFERGVLLLGCGATTIRLCPALVITRDEAEACLSVLDEVLAEIEALPRP